LVKSTLDKGFLKGEENTLTDSIVCLSTQIENEQDMESFITNKGMFNILTHAKLLVKESFVIVQFFAKFVKDRIKDSKYTEVFFIPYNGTDKKKVLIQAQYFKIFRELNIPYVSVDSVESAVQQVKFRKTERSIDDKSFARKTIEDSVEKHKKEQLEISKSSLKSIVNNVLDAEDGLKLG